jgi:hypothetical protein
MSFGECDSDTFVSEVNAAWVATNYPMIKQAITNRLAECSNDLLALGLLFEYYRSAEVDYFSAKAAAQEFVLAVSNRVPAEVIEKRVPMGLPILVAWQTSPTNIPVNQARTPEKVAYMHTTYYKAFPGISLYQTLAGRVEAIENGTFIWGEGFVEPEGE